MRGFCKGGNEVAYAGYAQEYRLDLPLPQTDVYRYKGIYEWDEDHNPITAAMGIIGGIGPGSLVTPVPEPYGPPPEEPYVAMSAFVCMNGMVATRFVREAI